MMPRPVIFVSAVSKELKSARQLVVNALSILGFDAETQETFGTEQGDLRGVLRQKIDGCKGVLQLIGKCYGAEPSVMDEEFGRVSYTQYEAHYAKKKGKKVWYLILGSSTFSASDIVDLPSFAKKLSRPADMVSAYINNNLSGATLTSLANYHGLDSDPILLQTALAQSLNIIIGSQSIFDAQRFAGVTFRPETQKLLAQNPRGDILLRLNRLLLEDAYPQEISREFFLADDYLVDPHDAEPDDLHELQAAYRRQLQTGRNLYHPIKSRAELEAIVLKLRNDLAGFRRMVKLWAAGVLGLLLILVAGGISIIHQLNKMEKGMGQVVGRGSPPEPTAADWSQVASAGAAETQYEPPAYDQTSISLKAGEPFHPKLALAIFGLAQGATNWVPLGPETSLRSGEHFFVRAETFTPGFLYIFEVDSSEHLAWLFPTNPTVDYSTGVNPVPARVALTIPAGSNKAYALDDNVGEERLYAIFSATRWEKLESALKAAGAGQTDTARHEVATLLAADEAVGERAKGIAFTEDTTVAKEVRQASSPDGEPLRVDLPAHSLEASGYWLMEVRRFQHLARATAP